MFEKPSRRHPVQTFQFWFIVLLSFGLVTAWKLDVFVKSTPATSSDEPHLVGEPMPPPPRQVAHNAVVRSLDELPAWEGHFKNSNTSEIQQVSGQMPSEQNAGKLGSAGQFRQDVTAAKPSQVVTAHYEDNGSAELAEIEELLKAERMIQLSSAQMPAADFNPTPYVRSAASRGPAQFEAQARISQSAQDPTQQTTQHQGQASAPGITEPMAEPAASRYASVSAPQAAATPAPATPGAASSEVSLPTVDRLIQEGKDIEAMRLLSQWYWTKPEQRSKFIDRLMMLSGRIYFQPTPHFIEPHVFQFGERFDKVAAKYNLSPAYLAKLNRIDPANIRTGQSLKVLQGPFSAVIDMSDMELTVHTQGYFVLRMRVGFGEDRPVRAGNFVVAEKIENPPYRGVEGSVQSGDSNNPLGSRLLVLRDQLGAGIDLGLHGTNDPTMIGKQGQAGCIRLNNHEMSALFDMLIENSTVTIKP